MVFCVHNIEAGALVEHPEPSSALGEIIRERRQELEMSQEAVALAADTDQARISRIETRGESPSAALFRKIARGLGWTGAELMRRLEEREQKQGPGGGSSPSDG